MSVRQRDKKRWRPGETEEVSYDKFCSGSEYAVLVLLTTTECDRRLCGSSFLELVHRAWYLRHKI